jgi:hypothetical protein
MTYVTDGFDPYVYKHRDVKRLTPVVSELISNGGCELRQVQHGVAGHCFNNVTFRMGLNAYAVGITHRSLSSLEKQGLAVTTGKFWKSTKDVTADDQAKVLNRKRSHAIGVVQSTMAALHEAGDFEGACQMGEALQAMQTA